METPDIRLLRSFLAVARDRSISAAARRLFVSQQTLSEQIRQLEKAVGVPLLNRGPRGVGLTAAGERLADGARGALVPKREREPGGSRIESRVGSRIGSSVPGRFPSQILAG